MRDLIRRQYGGETGADTRRTATLPNALCVLRIALVPVLLWLAFTGRAGAFVLVLAAALLTDWIDGKLAVLLRQRSDIGPRLDTVADVLVYIALVPAAYWLRPAAFAELAWGAVIVGLSYAVSVAAALWRFRKPPSYHTYLAKLSFFCVGVGFVVLVLGGPVWPVGVGMVVVVVANVEAVAITAALPAWRADVRSIVHARRPASDARRPRA